MLVLYWLSAGQMLVITGSKTGKKCTIIKK